MKIKNLVEEDALATKERKKVDGIFAGGWQSKYFRKFINTIKDGCSLVQASNSAYQVSSEGCNEKCELGLDIVEKIQYLDDLLKQLSFSLKNLSLLNKRFTTKRNCKNYNYIVASFWLKKSNL